MSEVLGKISFSDLPDVNTVPVLLNAGSTPSIMADILANRPAFGTAGRLFVDTTNNILQRDTGAAWVNIGSTSSPGSPDTSVQYNNGGAFAGNSFFTWNSGTNSLRINNGTPNLQLNLGGLADPGTASFYTEVQSGGTDIEAVRVYFNRGSAAISAWITNAYDGAAPYQRYIDGDNDPSYIRFDTVGSGSFGTPQHRNQFGSRGGVSSATDGFSWKYNGTEISSMGSQFFSQPSGTTGQRPTPSVGMSRFNSTEGLQETYQANSWGTQGGVVDKTVVTTTATGTSNFISYTVPGGMLGTNRLIRVKAAGTWANSAGANRQVTITISYGGVTMWSDNTANYNSINAVGWNIELYLASNNATGSQTLNGNVIVGGFANAPTTGVTGDFSTDEILAQAILTGTSTVNSNANQTLNVQCSFSGNGMTWTKYFHIIEVI
jgi:hypothetical protein